MDLIKWNGTNYVPIPAWAIMFCCTLVPVTSPNQHETGRDDRVRDGRLERTKLPSNNEWYCQGVGIFFSEPWVEVRLFHLQLKKWINNLAWTSQEFDIRMVGNRKSQNSRKPQLIENCPCDRLFSYPDILHITNIFNMYFFFFFCYPGWLYCLNR